jgi:hypothetical protein
MLCYGETFGVDFSYMLPAVMFLMLDKGEQSGLSMQTSAGFQW